MDFFDTREQLEPGIKIILHLALVRIIYILEKYDTFQFLK